MRLGDGTGEGVIAAYYGIRGWPMMLPSSERGVFLKKLHGIKVRILREMTAKGEVPLRPGVDAFLDDALADGASVAVVAGTASVADDGFVSSAMLNLGPNRAFKLRVVTMGGGSTDGGQQEEAAPSSAPDDDNPFANFEAQASAQRPRRDGVQAVQARAKSQAAKEFVRMYNLQKASGMGLEVDPKILSAAERAGRLTPSVMAALAATLGSPLNKTVVVAGGHSIMEGKSVGMLTLGVPPSVAMRGGFSAADAIFDGFGAGGGLTWRKARLILDKRNEKAAQ
ncbi:haloacid dehalogenase-like hydrolase domain-containing protein [Micractinium conductrix]|uniref:Haloacid dehalogenase-like hydrolase domain-containing protein n=1 Tax=Micractinium conductrix TaxID=554055 RepID=A0A2P6UYZ6_9CHLO|nr:haloacid dehalogenase-like hydrolase domain-containing protein [Micractinium conductrix]|eukprot:PSC67069.1 haloacid dehalogenase-like hydrolase domain-containing protein [Micractinium conductrix]